MQGPAEHHAAIGRLLELIRSSIEAIKDFPDLQKTPTPRLGLSLLASETFEAKNEIFKDLTILSSTLSNIAKRVDIPTLVGVIGRYSSGKSSLLNAFFHHIYDGNPPQEILRQVGSTSVDTTFTYITHTSSSELFPKSKSLDVTPVEHEFFKEINFIDTPGTGWEAFTETEVSNLLSAADVMLFLFKPTDVLDALSVEALSIKIKNFPEVPTLYVITGADHYTDRLDWSTLDLRRFEEDLAAAHQKLRLRDCKDQEEAQARDLVVKNVDFEVGEDTFLVDARYRHKTEELLEHIKRTFGSVQKKNHKKQQLGQEIRSRYRRFNEVAARAEKHIANLMNILRQTCNTVIKSDVSRFKTTTIASAAGALSRKTYAQISQVPLRIESSHQRQTETFPSAGHYETPEITLLNRHLEGLRQNRGREGFELKRKSLLFDQNQLSRNLDDLKSDLIKSIEGILNARWELTLVSKLPGSGRAQDLADKAMEILDSVSMAASARGFSEQRAVYLKSHVENAALGAAEYYAGPEIKKTIFTRHAELMETMNLKLPRILRRIQEYGGEIVDAAKSHALTNLNSLETTVHQSSAAMAATSVSYLTEHVYLPTKEALDFLFADVELTVQLVSEAPLLSSSEQPVYQFKSQEKHQALAAEIDVIYGRFTEDLEQQDALWETQRGRLEKDFDVLIQSSRKTSQELKDLLRSSVESIDRTLENGVSRIAAVSEKYKSQIMELVRDHQDLVESALASAKKSRKIKWFLKVVSAILGVLAPVLQVYWAGPTAFVDQLVMTGIAFVVGPVVAAIALASMINHRAAYQKSLRETYEKHRNKLTAEVRENLDKSKVELVSFLAGQNDELRSDLLEAHNKVIEISERANSDLLPNLDKQITAAADLSLKTSQDLAEIEGRMIGRIVSEVYHHLNASCSEIEEGFQQSFTEEVDQISQVYIQRLEGHIQQYKSTFEKLSHLRRTAQAEASVLDSAAHGAN